MGRGDPRARGHVIGPPRAQKISLPWRRGVQRSKGSHRLGPVAEKIPVPRPPYEHMHHRQLPLIFLPRLGVAIGSGSRATCALIQGPHAAGEYGVCGIGQTRRSAAGKGGDHVMSDIIFAPRQRGRGPGALAVGGSKVGSALQAAPSHLRRALSCVGPGGTCPQGSSKQGRRMSRRVAPCVVAGGVPRSHWMAGTGGPWRSRASS